MKRFTETEKWNDSWFMSLTATQKLAWFYIIERCDSCGVWDRNDRLANCQIGSHVDWNEAYRAFGNERVCVLPSGKWFILNFARFQYGRLTETSTPHKRVIEKAKAHGLRVSEGFLSTPPGIIPPRVGTTLEEEDRDKEEEGKGSGETISQRIDADLANEQGGNTLASRRPTMEALLLHGAKIGLPESEVHKFWNHYESNGWKVGKNPMKSYTHSMANWKATWEERRAQASGRPIGAPTLIDKELDRLGL